MQTIMEPQWDDSAPIYRQLRDRVVAMILEDVLKEGDPLPSVRSVAADFRLNQLTVLKGYQQLVDEQLVEKRRGRAMLVSPGARKVLMKDQRQCFIADVAVLPRWLRVRQALDFVDDVHPRFDRARATEILSRTDIPMASRVRELSKGMVTQLHLALVMAIDARLLVLDEPTLGLDLLYRRKFYDTLLNDY